MLTILMKYSLRLFPLAYMDLIWYQSAYFQPESVMHLSPLTLFSLGAVFEMLHFFQFGILYAALLIAMLTFGPFTGRKEGIALAVSVLYALLDELHQYYVPFRSATVSDVVKDITGIFVCWLILRKAYRKEGSRIGGYLKKCTSLSVK